MPTHGGMTMGGLVKYQYVVPVNDHYAATVVEDRVFNSISLFGDVEHHVASNPQASPANLVL